MDRRPEGLAVFPDSQVSKCVAFLPLPSPAHGTVDVDRENLLRDCVQASRDPALV